MKCEPSFFQTKVHMNTYSLRIYCLSRYKKCSKYKQKNSKKLGENLSRRFQPTFKMRLHRRHCRRRITGVEGGHDGAVLF